MNQCLFACLLHGGGLHLRESVKRSSTVLCQASPVSGPSALPPCLPTSKGGAGGVYTYIAVL